MDQSRWFRASLRISGETLRPDEIDSQLGIKSTRTHLRGEPRSSRTKLLWKHSLWLLESQLTDDSEPVEHLNWLLNLLEPKASVIKSLSGTFHVDLFCGFSSDSGQGGFTLDSVTLDRLARLGIPLTLDLYPPLAPSEGNAALEGSLEILGDKGDGNAPTDGV